MSDRPQFLSFMEGIGSGVLILVMLGGFIAQYFIFRTHTGDFEVSTEKSIKLLEEKNEALEIRMDNVTVADASLSAHIESLKRQIDRLEVQLDRVLERLR